MGEEKKSGLSLIQGRLIEETRFGSLKIVAAPEKAAPFDVQAFAFEEDTFLVLSADTQIRDPKIPLAHIMTRLIETQPEVPGSVLVRGNKPLRFLAVIHDLNQEPSWREEWIDAALRGIFKEAEQRQLRSIAIPLLGTIHGSLKKVRFVELLKGVLQKASFQHLTRLWLVVPPGTSHEVVGFLQNGYRKES